MIGIEEYILLRKNEDNLKEFNINNRDENTRICVNYVFDYFNQYLIQHEQEAKKRVNNDKVDQYRFRIHEFTQHVQEWLLDLYSKHNNLLHLLLRNSINKNRYFSLFYSEEDFIQTTNLCLTKLTKKYPYLLDERQGILLFVKDYHRIKNLSSLTDIIPNLPDEISNWLLDTNTHYNVNIKAFASDYAMYMFNHFKEYNTPKFYSDYRGGHQVKYDFYKVDNLFDIDNLYNQLYHIPFILNKKYELLTIITYYYIDNYYDNITWIDTIKYYQVV